MNPIKRLRVTLGITQFDLARLLGISESRISKFETGRAQPDSEALTRMAKVFDMDEKILLELIGSSSYISVKKRGDL